MGHGPQNPTPTFHFVKIIFSHLILMGQDPRLSKHKKIHVILMGQDPVLSKHIFVVILMGHGPHNPTPKKKVDTDGAGSTIVQAHLILMGHGPKIPPQLIIFSLDTLGARSTKSRPNFSLCENYFSHLILMGQDPRLHGPQNPAPALCENYIFSLDTHGAGSTIVQALCVNYYFFT